MLISNAAMRPPTITMANGRCESEPMPRDTAAGSNPSDRHQNRHHDRTKPQNRPLYRGVHDAVTARAKLVDVFQHNDSGLHRNSKERKETNTG